MNRWRLEDFYGSVTSLCDIIMMDTCNTFAQTHIDRMNTTPKVNPKVNYELNMIMMR